MSPTVSRNFETDNARCIVSIIKEKYPKSFQKRYPSALESKTPISTSEIVLLGDLIRGFSLIIMSFSVTFDATG